MVPVALVAKFTPVLGGLAREVLDGLSTSPAGGIAPCRGGGPGKALKAGVEDTNRHNLFVLYGWLVVYD